VGEACPPLGALPPAQPPITAEAVQMEASKISRRSPAEFRTFVRILTHERKKVATSSIFQQASPI
jgi:hypothetical protein